MQTERDSTEGGSSRLRRPRLVALGITVVAIGLLVVLVTTAMNLIGSGVASLVPRHDHGGSQIAEPSAAVVDDALADALAELHGHLNWLIWGPDDARLSPNFAKLADHSILVAEEQAQDQIADQIATARDLAIRDGKLREAHDLIQQAERVATPDRPDRERYTPQPQTPRS